MSLIKMSLSGAVMSLVIVVIRALAINRLPKKTFLALWGIALVRLLVPYSMPSAFSVYSLVERLARPVEMGAAGAGITTPPPGIALPVPGANATAHAAAPGTVSPAADPLVWVWAVGVLACGVFFAITWHRCRREFRESLPIEHGFVTSWLTSHPLRRTIGVRQSDQISAPLTYGVFHPVILLPKRTEWDDEKTLAYVLTHEYVHIRRFDAVTKLALTAALCVHWFNPVVWVMYLLANRDIELSCDEAVIRLFGEHTKSAYAMALIRMEETRSGLRPLCSNFSKNAIEERIIAIMKLKKTSMTALLVAVTLTVGVTTAFATTEQAAAAKDADKKSPADAVQTVMNDVTIMSYISPEDGQSYFSCDDGKTWTPINGENLQTAMSIPNTEWWTPEEYEAWLEQEKINLNAILGEKGWNSTDGWYTWDQAKVNETIAMYEQTLKDIRGGMRISKPTSDGDTMLQFGYDPAAVGTATESGTTVGFADEEYFTLGLERESQTWYWSGSNRSQTDTTTANTAKNVIDQLVSSIAYSDKEITFQIPDRAEGLRILAYGRAEYEDGFSQSLHFLDEYSQNWEPGKTYSIPRENAYTELAMDIWIVNQEAEMRTVDLLAEN